MCGITTYINYTVYEIQKIWYSGRYGRSVHPSLSSSGPGLAMGHLVADPLPGRCRPGSFLLLTVKATALIRVVERPT